MQHHGLSRRIRIFHYGNGEVHEGQIKNNKLDGFGRFFRVNNQAKEDYFEYIGYWKLGFLHGYGRLTINDKVKEGYFE